MTFSENKCVDMLGASVSKLQIDNNCLLIATKSTDESLLLKHKGDFVTCWETAVNRQRNSKMIS